MSPDDRASRASVTLQECEDGERAVGTFPSLAHEDREALRRLIAVGKMVKLADGSWGERGRRLITNSVAVRLKSRKLAVSGFNKEIVPTDRGRRLHAEQTQ